MLNMLRGVTSEGTSKNQISEPHLEGPSINFRKCQNKLNSLWEGCLNFFG